MHASFRGRKGGVDWEKKELDKVFKFVTELQLETPQDSDESTFYTNQMGQIRASTSVLIQLFVLLTGLNEHNTGLLAPPAPPRSFHESTKQYRYMALLSLTAPKSEMQKIKSM